MKNSLEKKKPLATVIVPTYNHACFIEDALDSLLNQSYEEIQIIVVDDGSTDQTSKILTKYKKDIKYVYQKNSGQAAAIKKGIGLAKGTYIFILNADDMFMANKIGKVVSVFESCPTVTHVSHPVLEWDGTSRKIEPIPSQILNKVIDGKRLLEYFYLNRFYGGGSTVAGRASIWKEIHIPRQVDMFIDEYLAISSLRTGSGYFIGTPLSIYRIHDSNYSRIPIARKALRNMKANKAILDQLDGEIKIMYELKTRIAYLKYKEIICKKELADVISLWQFLFRHKSLMRWKTIKNYRILHRTVL